MGEARRKKESMALQTTADRIFKAGKEALEKTARESNDQELLDALEQLGLGRAIAHPYISMAKMDDDSTGIELHDDGNLGYIGFAILIADLIQHVANSFNVDHREILSHIVQEFMNGGPSGNVQSFGSPQ